ncbi:methanogenic corrinoid protein MtbC1 [Clostridium punense]|uniref:Methanogenic corrinoid protein MtbC1 n=1 Tax=Clostridium punense TaxID=1054297 RepID=A0ABS4K7M2_9CLOT|nr:MULTISPECIES: cobalamin-dependent protein [Clostridium]EQB88557.1 hypothetical protein M918_03945 [Clostridium sp. BL8]MBP2023778.1 methanogenic corrinoid protein MtbC1 [Clostridium punense]
MEALYKEFLNYLEKEDKEAALNLILSKLTDNSIDIVKLYTEILTPSLNTMTPNKGDKTFIWKEHVRSSIIRTIIENCYPYVIKERDAKYELKQDKNIAVVCPPEEYHEIGARMVADFFTLLGYNATFVGSNTPKEDFINALASLNFHYVAISVSNFYNTISTKKIIHDIKTTSPKIKIFLGGSAFEHNKEILKELEADLYLKTFEDILKLAKEDNI